MNALQRGLYLRNSLFPIIISLGTTSPIDLSAAVAGLVLFADKFDMGLITFLSKGCPHDTPGKAPSSAEPTQQPFWAKFGRSAGNPDS